MRRVGILSFAQTVHARRVDATPGEMIEPVVREAVSSSGLSRADVGYTCAGSSDFLEGRPFSFGFALDYAGAVPPIEESHVEMDGAWAAYDCWARIQAGDVDSALAFAWGKSSEGSLPAVLNTTLDPIWEAPLGADAVAVAALSEQLWSQSASAFGPNSGRDRDAARSALDRDRSAGARNPFAQVRDAPDPVAAPMTGALRAADLPPVSDGAAAIVMAAEEVIASLGRPAAWIRGVAHATDAGCLGARDLTGATSARIAARAAAEMAGWSGADIAEIHAPFPHQAVMLARALALGGARINPSGGVACANPIMASGLIRLGEAALQMLGAAGERQVPGARRALAHATSGHALQSNMVWLLEAT